MAPQPITWGGKDAQGNPLLWDTAGLTWNGSVPGRSHKMPHLRVYLGFTTGPDHIVEETTGAVVDNLYGNAAYTTPPVTKVALEAALTAFIDAIALQQQGGTASTAVKNEKREALLELLRQLAAYVEMNCNNNLATLLSSGFQAASTNHAQQPLANPAILSVTNGKNTGQLVVKVTPIPNAKSYEVRYAVVTAGGAPGTWQHGGTFTDSRAMLIEGLTAGTMYQIQVRAVGGSTGYSGWSDSQNHMSL